MSAWEPDIDYNDKNFWQNRAKNVLEKLELSKHTDSTWGTVMQLQKDYDLFILKDYLRNMEFR